MTKYFVVIGCGKSKKELAEGEKAPAIEMYTGGLFTARRKYAEAVYGKVDVIVSALHGCLLPEQEISKHELDLRSLDKRSRDAWSIKVAGYVAQLAPRDAAIVLLCSGPYAEFTKEHEMRGRTIFDPCARTPKMGLGEQKAHLHELTRKAKALDPLHVERNWWAVNLKKVSPSDECMVSGAFMHELLKAKAA